MAMWSFEVKICVTSSYSKQGRVDKQNLISSMWPQVDPIIRAKNICWLKSGSPAHFALEELVLNTKLLKDLAKPTDFGNNGKIEVYHSEQKHFSYKGMVVRTQLAALDNNANAERPQALVPSGKHAGQKRYQACVPKAHKRWVVKPIRHTKSCQYLSALFAQVLEWC